MKNEYIKRTSQSIVFFLIGSVLLLLSSCENDSYEFELTDGNPEVFYVRLTDPESADSLLVAAYMDDVICLVGSNLRSIRELYFNDQKAVLNTSFITDNTLIVNVPKTIPDEVSNKIYMVSSEDTISYEFSVLVPNPVVNSMSCEYAHVGNEVSIYGDYFIDDPNVPLTINMAGNVPVTQITSIEKTKVSFIIPEGAQKGYINVTSIYGTGRSKFQYLDDRGMILDWDNLNASGGWRSGVIRNDNPVEGISGGYVYFNGEMQGEVGATWNEDGFSFNLWGVSNGRPEGDLFNTPVEEAVMKFEINVPQAWSAGAMQMIFTPWGLSGTNAYIYDDSMPRGVWEPWAVTGSYTTEGWVTVSIPLSDFKYTRFGYPLELASEGNYGGLTFFVHAGINPGTTCNPEICIDNIRVVPAE